MLRENLLGDGMLNRDGDLWKTVTPRFLRADLIQS